VIGAGLKRFDLLEHPDGTLQAVKDGFSWPGFFFSGLWLLWHRIWGLGSAALIIGLLVYPIFPSPRGYIMGIPYGHRFGAAEIINIFIMVITGIQGNAWQLDALRKRGFKRVGSVDAETADGARAAHILRQSTPVERNPFGRDEPHF